MDDVELAKRLVELEVQNDWLSEAYRKAPVGLCFMDTDLKYFSINEWLANINGMSVEEHLGRDIREILPQVAESVLPDMMPVLETGEPLFNVTRHVETAAHPGSKRLYQCSYVASTTAEGTIIGVHCAVADINEVFTGYKRDISMRQKKDDLRSRFVEQILAAGESERRRIAVDLHDGVCQMLSAAKLRLGSIEADGALGDLAALSVMLQHSIDEIRSISQNLHPAILEDLGVVAALRNACESLDEAGPCRVTFESKRFPGSLPRAMQTHLFRLVQEALQNAAKHSKGTRIAVSMMAQGAGLDVRVIDDGVGFEITETQALSGGIGIQNMTERARLLGADLEVDSSRLGTTVKVLIPWPLL